MHAFPCERIQICGRDRDKRFSFAGRHLGNRAAVKRDPSHELYIKLALAERAL